MAKQLTETTFMWWLPKMWLKRRQERTLATSALANTAPISVFVNCLFLSASDGKKGANWDMMNACRKFITSRITPDVNFKHHLHLSSEFFIACTNCFTLIKNYE